LIIACLQLISVITPVNPATTWGPLILIFAISAIKELVDDRARAAADKIANEKIFNVLKNGRVELIQSKNIRVGDILRLQENDEVPCDLVLLKSALSNGLCFIQTTNLDGETNLKTRTVINELKECETSEIERFRGVIECGPPDAQVYSFDSRIWLDASTMAHSPAISLSGQQFLQQTTTIRNTPYIYGAVVYTGNQTKFSMNKDQTPVKWTMTDKLINRIAVLLFMSQLALVVIFGIIGVYWQDARERNLKYLLTPEKAPFYDFLIIPARFLLLCSTIIPISLKVTLDFCKMLYAKYIQWDLKLYDVDAGHPPVIPNNTSISEDLGQIEYVLSDKTGTLTQNVMVFQHASLEGEIYDLGGQPNEEKSGKFLQSAVRKPNKVVMDFLLNIALNNGVVPDKKDGQLVYKSESPDEEALVSAAAAAGVRLLKRDGPIVELSINEEIRRYRILQELKFTSDRRRMSTVVKDVATGKLIVYIKGGDDRVFERLAAGESIDTLTPHIDLFAKKGLRTLAYGYKSIEESDFEKWLTIYQKASTALTDREAEEAKAFELLERDFHLTGASAIEDKLQVGVQAAIGDLREAGIRFWMLTGDKFQTALEIATACNLKKPDGPDSRVLEVAGESIDEVYACLRGHLAVMTSLPSHVEVCVVTRGSTMVYAYDPKNIDLFTEVTLKANAVVCCRFAPRQKQQIVEMVKRAGKMTLAIGDGGNDVVMIQAAHVGVGIRGKEGLQASRAADYQINEFRALKRLLLVHGRYSYMRTAVIAQYSYYKSLVFCFYQLAYALVSGWSGSSFFNSFAVASYNVLLFPPIMSFTIDQDISPEDLMANPELYRDCATSKYFSLKTYFFWILRGIFQGFVGFLFTLWCYQEFYHHANGGYPADYEMVGVAAFTAYFWVQTLTILLESKYITNYTLALVWFFHIFLYAMLIMTNSSMSFNSLNPFGATSMALADPVKWLNNLLVIVVSILPVIAVQYIQFMYFPTRADLTRFNIIKFRERLSSAAGTASQFTAMQ